MDRDSINDQIGKLDWRNYQIPGAKIGYDNSRSAKSECLGASYTILCDLETGALQAQDDQDQQVAFPTERITLESDTVRFRDLQMMSKTGEPLPEWAYFQQDGQWLANFEVVKDIPQHVLLSASSREE